MTELDPTKRTFGVTATEGKWLLCCDCPSEDFDPCTCSSFDGLLLDAVIYRSMTTDYAGLGSGVRYLCWDSTVGFGSSPTGLLYGWGDGGTWGQSIIDSQWFCTEAVNSISPVFNVPHTNGGPYYKYVSPHVDDRGNYPMGVFACDASGTFKRQQVASVPDTSVDPVGFAPNHQRNYPNFWFGKYITSESGGLSYSTDSVYWKSNGETFESAFENIDPIPECGVMDVNQKIFGNGPFAKFELTRNGSTFTLSPTPARVTKTTNPVTTTWLWRWGVNIGNFWQSTIFPGDPLTGTQPTGGPPPFPNTEGANWSARLEGYFKITYYDATQTWTYRFFPGFDQRYRTSGGIKRRLTNNVSGLGYPPYDETPDQLYSSNIPDADFSGLDSFQFTSRVWDTEGLDGQDTGGTFQDGTIDCKVTWTGSTHQ